MRMRNTVITPACIAAILLRRNYPQRHIFARSTVKSSKGGYHIDLICAWQQKRIASTKMGWRLCEKKRAATTNLTMRLVILIWMVRKTSRSRSSTAKKRKWKFAVAVFNGPLAALRAPSFLDEQSDLSDGGFWVGSVAKGNRLIAGTFESDNCIILQPRRKSYVWKNCAL